MTVGHFVDDYVELVRALEMRMERSQMAAYEGGGQWEVSDGAWVLVAVKPNDFLKNFTLGQQGVFLSTFFSGMDLWSFFRNNNLKVGSVIQNLFCWKLLIQGCTITFDPWWSLVLSWLLVLQPFLFLWLHRGWEISPAPPATSLLWKNLSIHNGGRCYDILFQHFECGFMYEV